MQYFKLSPTCAEYYTRKAFKMSIIEYETKHTQPMRQMQ